MSTKSGALPIERTYLRKVWLAYAAIALAFAVVIAIVAAGPTLTRTPQPEPAAKIVQQDNAPITINGTVCHQCR
ncbi:MAG: hypothetical protein ACT4PO_02340 [Actinomycetota bacterium]